MSCRQKTLNIGVNPNLLNRWKHEAEQAKDQAFKGQVTPRDEEVARLKRDIANAQLLERMREIHDDSGDIIGHA